MIADFNSFVDELLVIAMQRHNEGGERWVNFNDACRSAYEGHPSAWLKMSEDHIRLSGYGKFTMDSEFVGRRLLKLSSSGLSRAATLVSERRKPNLNERIRRIPWGKGIWEILKLSLAAFAGAVAKTYIGQ